MNEIKIFNNPMFGQIRTTEILNEPYFIAIDVCNALGYSNSRDAINRHVDSDDKSDVVIHDGSQNRQMTAINESGIYSLVFGSKLETAKQFKKWVTSEVLPAIRKTGGYIATTSEDTPELIMARALIVAQGAIESHKKQLAEKEHQLALAQKQLEYQAPKLKYANEVLSSTSGHLATTIASELNMSAITLNKLLCKAHFLRKTGKKGEYSLCASYQGKGYVVTNTQKYERPDESIGSRIEILYTEKGRMKIHEITGRAITAGVLREEKGRYFMNNNWIPVEKLS